MQLRREGRQFLFGTAFIAATMRSLLYVTHYDQQSAFRIVSHFVRWLKNFRHYKVFDKKKYPDV